MRPRREGRGVAAATVPEVRLARLVSTSAPVASRGTPIEPVVVVELGGVRVSVTRDADPGLVATVLALVGAGGPR